MIKNIKIWLLKQQIKANEAKYNKANKKILYTDKNIDYINSMYSEMNEKNKELIKKIKRLGG